MNKTRKAVAKRLEKLSFQMLALVPLVEQFSLENASQLKGAANIVIEWSEDILIGEQK
jgi:hypothetical protein